MSVPAAFQTSGREAQDSILRAISGGAAYTSNGWISRRTSFDATFGSAPRKLGQAQDAAQEELPGCPPACRRRGAGRTRATGTAASCCPLASLPRPPRRVRFQTEHLWRFWTAPLDLWSLIADNWPIIWQAYTAGVVRPGPYPHFVAYCGFGTGTGGSLQHEPLVRASRLLCPL